MTAGRLDRRYRFESRTSVEDGAGNFEGDWVPQYECSGGRKYLRAGEAVLAGRLTAKSPVILTIRNCIAARQIQPEWRAVDTRTLEVFAIKERPQESDNRGYMEMLCESGVAQ